MRVGDMSAADLARHLRGSGLHIDTGAFVVRVRSDADGIEETLAQAYANHPAETAEIVDHFDVALLRERGFRRRGRRGVQAYVGGQAVLSSFPDAFAFPMFESILNWHIAKQTLRYLIVHAGAAERDGKAVILTGPSGAGKSTLCAALAQTGWRLLSDELVLIRPEGPVVAANPRPISLKNDSIRRIAALAPGAHFSRSYEGTAKGTIGFLYPTRDAVIRAAEPARPRLVILPIYRPGAAPNMRELERAKGFMALVENSVNYFSTLRTGFEGMAGMTDMCRFYEVIYGDLEAALGMVERLFEVAPGGAEAA